MSKCAIPTPPPRTRYGKLVEPYFLSRTLIVNNTPLRLSVFRSQFHHFWSRFTTDHRNYCSSNRCSTMAASEEDATIRLFVSET